MILSLLLSFWLFFPLKKEKWAESWKIGTFKSVTILFLKPILVEGEKLKTFVRLCQSRVYIVVSPGGGMEESKSGHKECRH